MMENRNEGSGVEGAMTFWPFRATWNTQHGNRIPHRIERQLLPLAQNEWTRMDKNGHEGLQKSWFVH
jgi:hypothetical protein